MSERTTRRSDNLRRRREGNHLAAHGATGSRHTARRSGAHSTPAAPPPVLVRREGDWRSYPADSAAAGRGLRSRSGAGQKGSSRQGRRRYDIPLGVRGAEMRLPSLPRVRFGWRLLSALMLASLAYGLYFFWTTPLLKVQAAQVKGLERLTPRDVNAVLDIAGKPVFMLDQKEMRQELQTAFPEFSSVGVQVVMPATVTITVTERVPVMVWRQEGRTELVDAEGYAFPLRNGALFSGPVVEAKAAPPGGSLSPASPADLTPSTVLDQLVQGSVAGAIKPQIAPPAAAHPFLTPGMVQAVLSLAQKVPSDTVLEYTTEHGLMWKDSRGWEVYFGAMEDMDMKVQVYEALLDDLAAQESLPVLISVEHVHAPYYRLER